MRRDMSEHANRVPNELQPPGVLVDRGVPAAYTACDLYPLTVREDHRLETVDTSRFPGSEVREFSFAGVEIILEGEFILFGVRDFSIGFLGSFSYNWSGRGLWYFLSRAPLCRDG